MNRDDEDVDSDDEVFEGDDADDAEGSDDEVDTPQLASYGCTIVDYRQAKADMATAVKTTPNFLTKYERVRILGIRTKQLQLGARPLIDATGLLSEREIALKELELRRLPLIVRRHVAGRTEDWKLSDFRTI